MTYRMLDHWNRQGWVTPTERAGATRSVRRYDDGALLELGAMRPHPGHAAVVQGAPAPEPAHAPELNTDEPHRVPMATACPCDAPIPGSTLRRSYPRQESSALGAHAGSERGGGPSRAIPTAVIFWLLPRYSAHHTMAPYGD